MVVAALLLVASGSAVLIARTALGALAIVTVHPFAFRLARFDVAWFFTVRLSLALSFTRVALRLAEQRTQILRLAAVRLTTDGHIGAARGTVGIIVVHPFARRLALLALRAFLCQRLEFMLVAVANAVRTGAALEGHSALCTTGGRTILPSATHRTVAPIGIIPFTLRGARLLMSAFLRLAIRLSFARVASFARLRLAWFAEP